MLFVASTYARTTPPTHPTKAPSSSFSPLQKSLVRSFGSDNSQRRKPEEIEERKRTEHAHRTYSCSASCDIHVATKTRGSAFPIQHRVICMKQRQQNILPKNRAISFAALPLGPPSPSLPTALVKTSSKKRKNHAHVACGTRMMQYSPSDPSAGSRKRELILPGRPFPILATIYKHTHKYIYDCTSISTKKPRRERRDATATAPFPPPASPPTAKRRSKKWAQGQQ